MFQNRVESFFSQYILGGSQPLGNVTDYVIKIKFQMRGSPHAHCLLWVKDAPRIGHNTDDEVCAFVDKYITAVMPKPCKENEHDISLMKRLQKHTHSDYCRQKNVIMGSPNPHLTKQSYVISLLMKQSLH